MQQLQEIKEPPTCVISYQQDEKRKNLTKTWACVEILHSTTDQLHSVFTYSLPVRSCKELTIQQTVSSWSNEISWKFTQIYDARWNMVISKAYANWIITFPCLSPTFLMGSYYNHSWHMALNGKFLVQKMQSRRILFCGIFWCYYGDNIW